MIYIVSYEFDHRHDFSLVGEEFWVENVVELRKVNVAYLLKMLILMMIVGFRSHRRCCSQEHHHLVDRSSSRGAEKLMRTDEMACLPWYFDCALFLKLLMIRVVVAL